jgi:hypothetical protein
VLHDAVRRESKRKDGKTPRVDPWDADGLLGDPRDRHLAIVPKVGAAGVPLAEALGTTDPVLVTNDEVEELLGG